MEKDIENIDDLVGKILLLSKLDTWDADSTIKEINLSEVIEDSLKQFSSMIQSKSLELVTTIPPDLPPVKGNETEVNTVISNLLDNAVKYTPHKGKIILTLERKFNHTEILIENKSLRLSDNDFKNIFNPFFRGSETNVPGTGLGLAITKKIVENMEGQFEAQQSIDDIFKIRVRF